MRKIKVDVTEKDIRNGVCGSASKCAVSWALLRLVRGDIQTGTLTFRIEDVIVEVPRKASEFIDAYDRVLDGNPYPMAKFPKNLPLKGKLKPFTFTLRIPDEVRLK